MKKLLLKIDNMELEVWAQKVSGKIWMHVNGETHEYTPRSSTSHGTSAASVQDPSQIVAPMPGKVIKVFVQPGALVKEGETLVTMEAMKMEYNLKAIQEMKISRVNCQAGQQVSLGQVLVNMEEIDA